ncbi:hypothetical protein [Streptomyces caniscabiei]|uniref:hypothetical protein n=1 Tax=Streptomyces caniscabiei TaxID=2746961 RepID=UPI00076598EE|nr:hypothetical protein [Streptomyces caniscabiei]
MNRKSPARRRSSSLRAAAAGLVLAVGLGVSAQGPAQASVQAVVKAPTTASTTAVAAPKSVTGTPGNVVTRVADFYGAYIDAKGDYADPDAALAKALRKHYLTPDFAKRLAAWEKKNGADGVLRAQNIPARWTVTDNGSMGHAHEVTVTLTFGSGKTMKKSKLYVLVERYNHVSDIATKSAH